MQTQTQNQKPVEHQDNAQEKKQEIFLTSLYIRGEERKGVRVNGSQISHEVCGKLEEYLFDIGFAKSAMPRIPYTNEVEFNGFVKGNTIATFTSEQGVIYVVNCHILPRDEHLVRVIQVGQEPIFTEEDLEIATGRDWVKPNPYPAHTTHNYIMEMLKGRGVVDYPLKDGNPGQLMETCPYKFVKLQHTSPEASNFMELDNMYDMIVNPNDIMQGVGYENDSEVPFAEQVAIEVWAHPLGDGFFHHVIIVEGPTGTQIQEQMDINGKYPFSAHAKEYQIKVSLQQTMGEGQKEENKSEGSNQSQSPESKNVTQIPEARKN